jgi:predicted dehydrogenase
MMLQKIRIGMIGAGSIARQRHLPNLAKIPEVEVVAVCNARRESAERVAAEFKIPIVVDHWQDVIAIKDLNVIWIGTTPHLHAPITIAALQAGKHVFCQARMAMDLSEAREMLTAARVHNKQVTMLCPPPHGMKHGKYFKHLLNTGYIGQPYHFRLNAMNDMFSDPDAPAHWRQRVELSGMNIMSVGIYAEVLGKWLGQPLRLFSRHEIFTRRRGEVLVQVPDFVQVIGEWPKNLLGTLEWSCVAMHAPQECLEIYGREGTLVYNFITDEIQGAKRGEARLAPLTVPEEFKDYWHVEEDFIHAVRTRGHPQPDFETGVRYMEFVEMVHKSARERRWVDLPRSSYF